MAKPKTTDSKTKALTTKKVDGRVNNGKHLNVISEKGSDLIRSGNAHQKLTKQVARRLFEELDYDPLVEVVKMAKGQTITTDHPLIPYLDNCIAEWIGLVERAKPITTTMLYEFREKCLESLEDSYVSNETKAKLALELLQYVYPKLKAVDHHHSGGIDLAVQVKPLTKTDIGRFDKKFKDDY